MSCCEYQYTRLLITFFFFLFSNLVLLVQKWTLEIIRRNLLHIDLFLIGTNKIFRKAALLHVLIEVIFYF